ncbi:hypothetical protein [Bacillus sp. JJ1562]|uniref:hypothetical protein n=1 Tax=Bacillus sp. JJ1562 TaxID=3122960 RepID=UPI003001CDEB
MKVIDYKALSLGERFTSKFHITEQLVKDYIDVVEGTNQFDKVDKVPNYVFAIYKPIHEAVGQLAQGTIHLKQKMEHYSDVYIGDELEVIVTIKEKYKKNSRDYLVIEVEFLQDDTLVCKHETTHLWALA